MAKRTVAFFAMFILFAYASNAQQKEFGDVSIKDLNMEYYAQDSTADAVILFDVGEVYVNEDLEVNFKRHVRIKILTDNGLDAGDISIGFRDVDPKQDIRKIKAETYNLEDGKLKKTKLGKRDKFENEITESWSEIKFTMPALRKGSVFEYSYEMKAESPVDIPDWFFQREYPTVWSEYVVNVPEWFRYITYNRGYHNFAVNKQEIYKDRAIFSGGNRLDYSGFKYTYAMKDVPAITSEPFMKVKTDYLAQVRFQLSSYKFPNSMRYDILNSWPSIVESIDEDSDYGDRIKSSGTLKSEALSLIADSMTDLEKMIAVYEHVGDKMEWDENYRLFAYDRLDDIYKKGTGNSTEINLILLQMLREVGIEAHPVIMSTRTNGEIIKIYPLHHQFNHTIIIAKVDGQQYLLDGKNGNRPYNILPSSVLNGEGLVIKKDHDDIEWVALENKANNKLNDFLNITINEEGEISGVLQSSNEGYLAYLSRELLKDYDESTAEERAQEYLFDNEDIEVDSVEITQDDPLEGFDYKIHFRTKANKSGNVMYLNPMLVESIKENPFKKENRTYPIDYDYTFNKRVIMMITLPEGWAVDESPESKAYKLKNNSGGYTRLIQPTGSMISIRYDFAINKMRFLPNEYEELKFLYENVASDNSERIVLVKNEE